MGAGIVYHVKIALDLKNGDAEAILVNFKAAALGHLIGRTQGNASANVDAAEAIRSGHVMP
jgi:hypothetical protein